MTEYFLGGFRGCASQWLLCRGENRWRRRQPPLPRLLGLVILLRPVHALSQSVSHLSNYTVMSRVLLRKRDGFRYRSHTGSLHTAVGNAVVVLRQFYLFLSVRKKMRSTRRDRAHKANNRNGFIFELAFFSWKSNIRKAMYRSKFNTKSGAGTKQHSSTSKHCRSRCCTSVFAHVGRRSTFSNNRSPYLFHTLRLR
jgi:hypothetical protein